MSLDSVRPADLRLAIPAAATWIAAAVTPLLRDARPAVLVLEALAVVAVGLLLLPRRTGRSALVVLRAAPLLGVTAVTLALAGVAVTAGAIQLDAAAPPMLRDAAEAGRTVQLRAEVAASPVTGRCELTIRGARAGDLEWTGSSPALLFGAMPRGLRPGDVVELRASLSTTSAGDDVAFLLFPRSEVRRVARAGPLQGAAAELRARFAATTARLPGDGGRLLPGLAVGDTSRVDESLAGAMKTASLTHLTAVSGSNCAVVVALAVGGLGLLGAPRLLRIGAALVLLAGFVLLVTPQPSVIRAAAMATAVLVALALGRPVRGLPVLGTAVIVLVLGDPRLARDYGFALSVLATGGLLLLARPVAGALGRVLPRWLALAIAVPTSAQLACQPVLLLLSPVVPLYGVPANLLAEPAAPMATILGLLGCVAGSLSPPAASALAALAWLPSAWIAAVARGTAALPGASLPWLPGVGGALAMVVLTVGVLVALLVRRRRILSLIAGGAVALTVVAWLGGLAGSAVATAVSRPADWQYAQCDIGQGDAVLIRSAGAVALVDTGPKPQRLAHCLDELGIRRIDLLVLTHYDLN